MTLLEEIHANHKARLQRIAAAAWKPRPILTVVQSAPEPAPEPEPAPRKPLTAMELDPPPPPLAFPRIRLIQRIVADEYKITLLQMCSAQRDKVLVRPRHIAMYLCRILTPHSLPEIGRRFQRRDHTTVHHAYHKIEKLLEADPALVVEIEELKQLIGQARPE